MHLIPLLIMYFFVKHNLST